MRIVCERPARVHTLATVLIPIRTLGSYSQSSVLHRNDPRCIPFALHASTGLTGHSTM